MKLTYDQKLGILELFEEMKMSTYYDNAASFLEVPINEFMGTTHWPLFYKRYHEYIQKSMKSKTIKVKEVIEVGTNYGQGEYGSFPIKVRWVLLFDDEKNNKEYITANEGNSWLSDNYGMFKTEIS